jgi:putative mRNA 3-end processing factor
MHSLDFVDNFGFLPFRRKQVKANRRGRPGLRPHLSLRFNFGDSILDFHVDSSKGSDFQDPSSYYNFFNLITHAHSDHYGQNNMNNSNAVASVETANILRVLTGKEFKGRCFSVGDSIKLDGIKIKTYPTEHIFGSSAFLIKSDSRILITGDVKDYSKLPKCDVLITEATYGNSDHIFEEEVEKLIECAKNSVFGVYPVGKAQRTAKILIENGFDVCGEDKISNLCSIFDIEVKNLDAEDGDVTLVSPRNVYQYAGRKFILTAQKFYRVPRIVISDHLDFIGILEMIDHCNPEHVIFYHGSPSKSLIDEISDEKKVSLLKDLEKLPG